MQDSRNGSANQPPYAESLRPVDTAPAQPPAGESWREHPVYSGYLVSDQGRVRKLTDMTLSPDRDGYVEVIVWIDGKRKKRGVSTLVLETFVGPRPEPEHHARHLNSVKADNRLRNLAWGTPKENANDNLVNGTRLVGERAPNAKLTEDQARYIKAHATSTNARELAGRFGVTRSTVMAIIYGKAWNHVR